MLKSAIGKPKHATSSHCTYPRLVRDCHHDAAAARLGGDKLGFGHHALQRDGMTRAGGVLGRGVRAADGHAHRLVGHGLDFYRLTDGPPVVVDICLRLVREEGLDDWSVVDRMAKVVDGQASLPGRRENAAVKREGEEGRDRGEVEHWRVSFKTVRRWGVRRAITKGCGRRRNTLQNR
ncbi:hypothetical protein T492DRAFT_839148 [Pavlovales sp. CCMP2436]|nr:hypothetical protein T492DRAFT_839148 [Pavlovales sp. CCMP2436]